MSQTPQNLYENVNNGADNYYGTLFSHLSYGMGEAAGGAPSALHPTSAEAAVHAQRSIHPTEWSNPTGGYGHHPSSSSALGALCSQFGDLGLRHDSSPCSAPSSYGNHHTNHQTMDDPNTSALLAAFIAAVTAAYHPMAAQATPGHPPTPSNSVVTGGSASVHNQNASLLSNQLENYRLMNASMLPYYGDGDGSSGGQRQQPPNYMMVNHHQHHHHHQPTECWPSPVQFDGSWTSSNPNTIKPVSSGCFSNSQIDNSSSNNMYYVPPNIRAANASSIIPLHNSSTNNGNYAAAAAAAAVQMMMSSGGPLPPVSSTSTSEMTYSQMLPFDHHGSNYHGLWSGHNTMICDTMSKVNNNGGHALSSASTPRFIGHQQQQLNGACSNPTNRNTNFRMSSTTHRPPKTWTSQPVKNGAPTRSHYYTNTKRNGVVSSSRSQPTATPNGTDNATEDDVQADLEESKRLHQSLSKVINPSNFNTQQIDKARFFVIKSFSEDDIHRSIKYAIWCSTEMGNQKLDTAYSEAQSNNFCIYLFFSVNGSGHFCGMAQMTSHVDYSARAHIWAQDKWQGKFNVQWIFVKDIPNAALRHIRLETNENRPVTHSRDTTELPFAKGKQMTDVFATYAHTSSIFDDFLYYEQRERQEGSRRKDAPNRRS